MPPESDPASETERCDLVVVGAGIAGLNALFVATQYLSRDQKVVLIDRRERGGGMWTDTYPYVRLHQPHQLFTAGALPWKSKRPAEYLATRDEVLDHMERCLGYARDRLHLDERFGWVYDSHTEDGDGVQVTCTAPDGRRTVVRARRMIKAFGYRIGVKDPFPVSSAQVRSVSPNHLDIHGSDLRDSESPVWVIGSGKTGMDTADAMITHYPGREVSMVAGSGSWFLRREKLFPAGARRWWDGRDTAQLVEEVARRFDGTNEKTVNAWMREHYGIGLRPEGDNFMFGFLSEPELHRVDRGLHELVMDHLVDAVDGDDGPELVFRSGARRRVPAGSWIVNCTSYIMGNESPYEPYVSPGGSVLSLHMRSATLPFSTYMGYLMPHVMFLDKLRAVPLYELDVVDLREKAPTVVIPAMMAQARLNISLILDHVPSLVFKDFGTDLDRWYPLPRWAVRKMQFKAAHHRGLDHFRRTLDTVGERFDVRCGPLV
ncbi:potassium transporter [Nocardia carnea]|uniref:potassium transporter n=1 Tax=Nocardia carnea TaxID=37328 RepID=UPI002457B1B7|nr:potassium transporter [Nocardia carnea]